MTTRPLESPTLIERFVGLLPLPYPVAAFVWCALLGSPGLSTLQYLVTGTSPLSLATLPNVLLNLLFTYFLFLMVRFVRLRVVAAEGSIAARLSGGEQDYHAAFGRMAQTAPVVLIAASMAAFLLATYATTLFVGADLLYVLLNIVVVCLDSFAFATYLWEFLAISVGLHRLGGSSLRLESFLEDRLMGTKPLGVLALVLTLAYFGGLLFAVLLLSTILPSSITGDLFLAAFVVVGVGFFLLPLNSIHRRMRDEKLRLSKALAARYPRLDRDPGPAHGSVTLDDVGAGLRRLTDLQELELLEKRVASLPTWPFDIQVASRFLAIVLSVTAVLLARVISDFLRI